MSELRLREDGLFWRESGQDVVVLDGADSTFLAANRTGALLWKRLAGGARTSDLVAILRDRYGLSPERAERDVAAFVASLRASRLLAGCPADDGDAAGRQTADGDAGPPAEPPAV